MTAGERDVASGRTLWSLAAHWAGRHSGEPALVALPDQASPDRRETLSWQDLAELVWRLRQRLAAAGVTDG